jgi:hypothetical protein
VVDNNYHVRHRVSKEAMYNWAEDTNSVLDYVRRAMANEMADGLLKNIPIRRVPENRAYECNYYTEYEMNCVILDEQEYRELLKAKRDLNALRGIVNGK